MEKDKMIEELFADFHPELSDNDRFMASLNRKLDAVEYIKQHQEVMIRRYKMAMVMAFVVGIISGAVTITHVLSLPTDAPLFTLHVQSGVLLWLAENSRLITTTALSLLMTCGLISIVSNIQDIMRMRVRVRQMY